VRGGRSRSTVRCSVSTNQQGASRSAGHLIDDLSQMSKAFGAAAADGGSGRERTPALPLLGIGTARGFTRRRGVWQIDGDSAGRAGGHAGMLGQSQRNLQEAAGQDEIIGKMWTQRTAPPRGAGNAVPALANQRVNRSRPPRGGWAAGSGAHRSGELAIVLGRQDFRTRTSDRP
jgi:hypothetical protein